MSLDADAQAVIDLMSQAFPGGLHSRPIAETRARMAEQSKSAPPGPDMARVHDSIVPAGDHEIPVRLYWPTTESDQPALIWLHGGAFALGTLDGADSLCRELASQAGVVVASVDYRLAPEHKFPAGVEDAYTVSQWVAKNHSDLGINATRVAIGGDSAGGTLAASVALMARDRSGPGLAFQLLVYPTTLMRVSSYEYVDDPLLTASMVNFFWDQYVERDSDLANPYCAPLNAGSLEGLPPAFVVIPEVDPTRADQEAYAERLATSGVLTTYKVYLGMPHGFFGMSAALAKARTAVGDAGRLLRAHLHEAD
jgi:acetyl esterase